MLVLARAGLRRLCRHVERAVVALAHALAARAAADFPQKHGKIVDLALARQLETYLNAQKALPVAATPDEVNQQTTLKSPGDVLVYLRKLSHH